MTVGDTTAAGAVDERVRVEAVKLGRVMTAALARRGVEEEHRAMVVEGLVGTSLRGIDTHGVRLFPTYLAELDGGRADPRPTFTWHSRGHSRTAQPGKEDLLPQRNDWHLDERQGETGENPRRKAGLLLDAGAALGLVAGTVAAREAARLASEHGVGAVAVANSNHFGAASVYTLEMARRGALGLSFTNSDALVAPFGGQRPFFGTNPLSLAVAGDDGELFCVDMATSQVSYSRVKRAREADGALEPGWAVGEDGGDAAAGDGEVSALSPLGGYKGQCLGMIVEVLCTLLTGEPFDHELSHLYVPPFDAPRRVGHLFVAFDVAHFTDPSRFRRRLAALLAMLRDQPAAGGEAVIAPGDLEAAAEADRRAHGIPLAADELHRFRTIDASAPEGDRVGL